MTPPTPEVDARLAARLRALADAIPHDATLADRVIARIVADDVRPQSTRSVQLRRWIVRSSIGLAATVGLAAGVWSLVGTPRPAFAVEDVAARLRSLHSLHLKGEFAGDKNFGGPHPIEIFIREPDCMRVNGQTISENGRVRIVDLVYSPGRFTTIDETNRTVSTITFPPTPAAETDLRAEVLQTFVQMMFGPDHDKADFRRLRSETVGGIATDVYEYPGSESDRITVWFNPVTRLPVRTAYGPTRFDTIEPDPVIPDAVFHPAVPVGYAVVQPKLVPPTDPDAAAESGDNCSFGGMHLNVRYLLALSGGDVLACWCFYDSAHGDADLKLPDAKAKLTIRSQHGTTYTDHLLHADATAGGWHWRWSLLRPPTPPPAGSFVMLSFKAGAPGGSTGEVTDIPLTLSPDALAKEVDGLQRQTLPPGVTPMTLEQIEAAGKTK